MLIISRWGWCSWGNNIGENNIYSCWKNNNSNNKPSLTNSGCAGWIDACETYIQDTSMLDATTPLKKLELTYLEQTNIDFWWFSNKYYWLRPQKDTTKCQWCAATCGCSGPTHMKLIDWMLDTLKNKPHIGCPPLHRERVWPYKTRTVITVPWLTAPIGCTFAFIEYRACVFRYSNYQGRGVIMKDMH